MCCLERSPVRRRPVSGAPVWRADARGPATYVVGPSDIVQVNKYTVPDGGEVYSERCTFGADGEGSCVGLSSFTYTRIRPITESFSVHASVATILYSPAKNAGVRIVVGLGGVLAWSVACGLLAITL
jgi:hypothetical protein